MRLCRGKSHFTERIKLRSPAANPIPMPASRNHGEVPNQRSSKYPSKVPTSNPASKSEDARKARPQAAPDEGGGSSGLRSSPRKRSRRAENASRSDGLFSPVLLSSLEATINMPENRCATNARTPRNRGGPYRRCSAASSSPFRPQSIVFQHKNLLRRVAAISRSGFYAGCVGERAIRT